MFAPCLPEPERLVGLGFRLWSLGTLQGEIGCWERAWNLYAERLGAGNARRAVTDLSLWVAAVNRSAAREIEVFPEPCRSFCRDECLAVSMIAACQQDTCPAVLAYAFALAESEGRDAVLSAAQRFAATLADLDHRLSPHSIATGLGSMTPTSRMLQ
jgi:hypothetical protein